MGKGNVADHQRQANRQRLGELHPRVRLPLSHGVFFAIVITVALSVKAITNLSFTATALAQEAVPEPQGYRLENYDDFVPEQLTGATAVDAEQVASLRDSDGAVIIDVIPEQRRPEKLPAGQIWIPVAHQGVPGSLWLPDVGYGVLSEKTESYFRHHLDTATQGNKAQPLVFYCRDNCWMSWNAAKRALTYGFTDVYWFVEGTDGWFDAGYPFKTTTPAPGERH